MSWGAHSVRVAASNGYAESWTGSGLRAELIGGYELTRATRARTFVQLDVALPLYRLSSTTYTRAGPVPNGTRYSPAIAVSLGVGWNRHPRR